MTSKMTRREFVKAGAAVSVVTTASPTLIVQSGVRPLVISAPNGNFYKNGGTQTCVETPFELLHEVRIAQFDFCGKAGGGRCRSRDRRSGGSRRFGGDSFIARPLLAGACHQGKDQWEHQKLEHQPFLSPSLLFSEVTRSAVVNSGMSRALGGNSHLTVALLVAQESFGSGVS